MTRTMAMAALVWLASGCDLEARSEARARRRAIQQSEEEARLARARYCADHPAECGPDEGVANKRAARAPTYRCTSDAWGETCRAR